MNRPLNHPVPPPLVPPLARVEAETAEHSPRLSLTVHRPRPGRVLVRVHGEVDLGTIDDLRRVLAVEVGPDSVTGCAPEMVVCDLGGVTFLGAIGIGALAEAGDAARRCGTRLVLVAATRPVRRLLELCGLDRQLPIASRLADLLEPGSRAAPGPGTPRGPRSEDHPVNTGDGLPANPGAAGQAHD